MSKKTLYIAYGSNINKLQMQQRCPGAEIFAVGTIEGWQLEFNKVATLVKRPGEQTPCLVWSITSEHEKSLDKYEGYPYKYGKKMVDVTINGETIKAMAYIMNDSSKRVPPKDEYYYRILDGYEDAGLDTFYLDSAVDRAFDEQEQMLFSSPRTDNSFYESQDEIDKARCEGFKAAIKYAAYIGLISEEDTQGITDKEILDICGNFLPMPPKSYTLGDIDCSNEYKLYIAYGSNMNLEQMQHRCPRSKPVASMMLNGYELVFDSFATIERNPDAKTPIVLWQIHRSDWLNLDRYEGYPNLYRKEILTLALEKETVPAVVYIMNRHSVSVGLPSAGYIEGIKQGYKSAGLDLKYLNDAVRRSIEQFNKSSPKKVVANEPKNKGKK